MPSTGTISLKKINQATEAFEISVSSKASVENVIRVAESKNWKIENVRADGQKILIYLRQILVNWLF